MVIYWKITLTIILLTILLGLLAPTKCQLNEFEEDKFIKGVYNAFGIVLLLTVLLIVFGFILEIWI